MLISWCSDSDLTPSPSKPTSNRGICWLTFSAARLVLYSKPVAQTDQHLGQILLLSPWKSNLCEAFYALCHCRPQVFIAHDKEENEVFIPDFVCNFITAIKVALLCAQFKILSLASLRKEQETVYGKANGFIVTTLQWPSELNLLQFMMLQKLYNTTEVFLWRENLNFPFS